jgi:hypothetical protein
MRELSRAPPNCFKRTSMPINCELEQIRLHGNSQGMRCLAPILFGTHHSRNLTLLS